MSYKVEMLCDGQWCSNACRFETEHEADNYGLDLILRWTVPSDYRVAESDDPVNYAYIIGNLGATLKRLGE